MKEVLLTAAVVLGVFWIPCGICGLAELASRMGISIPTARKYIKDPGKMSMDDMRQINRILDIEAEETRGLLPMK